MFGFLALGFISKKRSRSKKQTQCPSSNGRHLYAKKTISNTHLHMKYANMFKRKFLLDDSHKARRVGQNFQGNFKPDRQKVDISQKIQIVYGTPEPNEWRKLNMMAKTPVPRVLF